MKAPEGPRSDLQGQNPARDKLTVTMICPVSIDISYDPAIPHRRQRMEWPTHDANLCHLIAQPSAPTLPCAEIISRTKAMLDAEFAKCDIRRGMPADEAAVSYYHFTRHNNDFGPLLQLLYWRGRQQSAVYELYQELCKRRFIPADSVALPMSIDQSSESVQSLTWRLQCFEGPAKECGWTGEGLFSFQDNEFFMPLKWLATMLVRSKAVDIEALLQTILASTYLGGTDEAKLEEYEKYCPWKTINCDPQAGACRPDLPSQFGFWLPHGVRVTSAKECAEDIQACIGRFERIEECFQEWFAVQLEDILTAA